jgi:hypothetical protein
VLTKFRGLVGSWIENFSIHVIIFEKIIERRPKGKKRVWKILKLSQKGLGRKSDLKIRILDVAKSAYLDFGGIYLKQLTQ